MSPATHRERGDPQTIDREAAKAIRAHIRTRARLRAMLKRRA